MLFLIKSFPLCCRKKFPLKLCFVVAEISLNFIQQCLTFPEPVKIVLPFNCFNGAFHSVNQTKSNKVHEQESIVRPLLNSKVGFILLFGEHLEFFLLKC